MQFGVIQSDIIIKAIVLCCLRHLAWPKSGTELKVVMQQSSGRCGICALFFFIFVIHPKIPSPRDYVCGCFNAFSVLHFLHKTSSYQERELISLLTHTSA